MTNDEEEEKMWAAMARRARLRRAREEEDEMQRINLIAPLNQLGYGQAGINIALGLKAADVQVAMFPIGMEEIPEEYKEDFAAMKANAGFYEMDSPCLRIWHQDQLAEFVGKGTHIGFPFFELDTLNARERHHLNALDRIFVASTWAKGVIKDQIGREDAQVVPLGVDRSIFHEGVEADKLEVDHTTFINVGKWEVRKGHDFLLRAFCKAFTPTDKVSLLMVPYNPFIGPKNDVWAREYYGSPMGRQIKLLPRLTDQKTLSKVAMAGADCGVFPSRAEGWNLELLELMSMGKHVITTYATAHTEFANTRNARLIVSDEVEPAEDGIWFHGQGNWTKLGDEQEEQLINHMREVHRLKQTGQLPVNEAGIETAKFYSWQRTAATILEALQ